MDYAELIKAVKGILREYSVKLTLRQIYYRLVSKNLIPNTKASYKGLSKQLVKAREKGDIDGSRMEDRSRKSLGYGDYGYDSIEQFIQSRIRSFQESASGYSKKMWESQNKKVLICLEKDALSRLFTDVAGDFRIQVYPTRGYGSYTFVNDMAGDLSPNKENVILYFGDYDPSGRDIQRDLRERLIRYYGTENFTVIRIALTESQISEYDLPPMPEDAETLAKLARDPRAKTYGLKFAVELDAIDPDKLQGLIKGAIMENIDMVQWAMDEDQIQKDRDELREKFSGVTITFKDGTVFTSGED